LQSIPFILYPIIPVLIAFMKKKYKLNHKNRTDSSAKINRHVNFSETVETIRLNRFIARSGICSRRQADEYIKNGWITVNGEKVTELGSQVPLSADVRLRGKRILPEKNIYILLNKPKDYITTLKDPKGRKTVTDLIDLPEDIRIFPVGRLDRNTTGVLLLTNDGDLAEKLAHPRYKHRKVYQVTLDKDFTRKDLEQLVEGVELEEGYISADAASSPDPADKKTVGIEIHSGQNRVVRHMFEKLGYQVKNLDRVYFAGLTKKGLPRGKWRYLTEKEISMLHRKLF